MLVELKEDVLIRSLCIHINSLSTIQTTKKPPMYKVCYNIISSSSVQFMRKSASF